MAYILSSIDHLYFSNTSSMLFEKIPNKQCDYKYHHTDCLIVGCIGRASTTYRLIGCDSALGGRLALLSVTGASTADLGTSLHVHSEQSFITSVANCLYNSGWILLAKVTFKQAFPPGSPYNFTHTQYRIPGVRKSR